MTKRRSIVCLTIAVLLILILMAFCFWPKTEIGIIDVTSPIYNIKLGLDLKGGSYVTFEVETTEKNESGGLNNLLDTEEGRTQLKTRIDETSKAMHSRLTQIGYADAVTSSVGNNKIKVEIPNVKSETEILKVLNKVAELVIRIGNSDDGDIVFEAKDITAARAYYDSTGQISQTGYFIQLELNSTAQKALSAATADCEANPASVYFLFDDDVVSEIPFSAQTTGSVIYMPGLKSYEEASNYAIQINSGSYKVTFKDYPDALDSIGAKLGEKAIETIIIAAIVGIALILVFLVAVYGFMGVASALSMLYYVALMVLTLAFLPFVQLTLPGVAGLALGMAITVGSAIIIFEKIKEEYRSGKSRENAIQLGVRRSVWSILDSNFAVFFAALAFYILAPGAIMDFTLTLMLSIGANMIITFVFLRVLLKWFSPLSHNDKLFALKTKTQSLAGKGGKTA